MKNKSREGRASAITWRLAVMGCLLVATGLAVWLRKFTVALPLLAATTLAALALLNAIFEAVMLD